MNVNPVAVITGGASGIGFAFAEAYVDRGMHVLLADIDEAALEAARDHLSRGGATVETRVTDVRVLDSVAILADQASSIGPLGAVCFNAGVTSTGTTAWETPPDLFDFVLDVNLRGLFNCIHAFVPLLVAQGGPADIVVTASMAGLLGMPGNSAYGVSKAAAVALTKALRGELATAAPQLRVTLLNPGLVKTNLMRTSAAQLPAAADMSADLVQGGHDLLNEMGVDPAEAAGWALRALDENRFWALPPESDVFSMMLKAEQEELRDATHG